MEDFTYINKELGTNYKSNKEIDWYAVSRKFKLSESFIEKYQDKVNWTYISAYQKLSEEFIEKFQDKVDWYYISMHQKLSEGFIEKFQDKVYWNNVSTYQKLSEEFIEKYQDKVDWYYISTYQILSEPFIEKHLNNINCSQVEYYQKLSDEFIKVHNLNIDKDNLWQYKDAKFKKQELIKTEKYECHDDYFIAYKAIRKDRYSLYNFQYQYLSGETYESTCDCTASENSFGLNVGTYDFAKDYLGYNKGIIVKCKISYEDIGRIVHDGEKVRCFKITILE